MSTVQQTVDDGMVELDVCKGCQMVWFDAGEDEAIAGDLPQARRDPIGHLPPKTQLEVKKAEAQLTMAASQHHRGFDDVPSADTGLNRLLAFVGMPVEDGEPARRILPVVSRGLAVAMILLGLVAVFSGDSVYASWGFLAEANLRGGGLPAVGGLLLDPRIFSVVLNVGMMWRLGDNVEDLLGHVGFTLLVVVASGAAWFVHSLGLHQPGEPMFGLTSATAAVAVLYGMRFPDVRLGWYAPWDRQWKLPGRSNWVLASARKATWAWVFFALALPWLQSKPDMPSSGEEALVGAAVGWLVYQAFGRGVLHHPDEI